MASRRAAYLPIAFIVVSILILGTAVAIVSFRDIGRGRAQVAEILGRQAGGIMAVLGADLRAELVAPAWQRSRLERFFQNVIDRENVAYIAILDSEGRILVHSDPSKVGTAWTGPLSLRATVAGPRARRDRGRPDDPPVRGPDGGAPRTDLRAGAGTVRQGADGVPDGPRSL